MWTEILPKENWKYTCRKSSCFNKFDKAQRTMLAPPPIILDSTSIDDPLDISSSPIACSYYDRRGSSLTPRQMSESQSNKRPRGRIRSASVFDEGLCVEVLSNIGVIIISSNTGNAL